MPGHFLVKHMEVDDLYVDPYNSGVLLSEKECRERLEQSTRGTLEWDSRYLLPVGNREFVARMLRNLKTIYLNQRDFVRALTMVDWLIRLQPGAEGEIRDRGLVHYRLGNYQRAQADLQDYLSAVDAHTDIDAVKGLIDHIRQLLQA
jgi:regulator of sirC expression with transglutaminase-like and TPR domain